MRITDEVTDEECYFNLAELLVKERKKKGSESLSKLGLPGCGPYDDISAKEQELQC